MRILVTGVTGFAGGHLVEALLAGGQTELHGTSRRGEWPGSLRHLSGAVRLHACDLCDGAGVEALLRDVRPEQIYHLAGYAGAGQSLREPDAAWAGNLAATRTIFDAVHAWGGRPRILYVSSGLIYGDPEFPDQAQHERLPLCPTSPYATSKAAADLLSYQVTRVPGLEVVRVRPFNHIGPRQALGYAIADWAHQVAAIERGVQPPVLQTGNLTSRRDLTDVRDMVRAYVLLMEQGKSGDVFNVGTGTARPMQEFLDQLLALSPATIEVRQASGLVRQAETTVIRADASRLRAATGWAPSFDLPRTLADTLAYWRNHSSS